MTRRVSIGPRIVGAGQPCLIVAEAGVNHGASVEVACRLVEAAARAGADAVKFQAFDADRLVTADAPKAEYQRRTTAAEQSQHQMLKALEFSPQAHREAADASRRLGLIFLSTPFDETSADALDALGVPAFKLASGELTNLTLLAHVARKRKPMLVSTGMATLGEVDEALAAITAASCDDIVLMHCTSRYPAEPSEANLRAIPTLSTVFRRPCGYSDHTTGHDVTLAAVACGACVIEKHLTLDRTAGGPDHAASLEPGEFAAMVRAVRTVERALGDGRKRPVPGEGEIANVARRSLVAARLVPAGSVLDADAVVLRRPGTGLSADWRDAVVGRTARVDIPAGTLLAWELLV